VRTIPIILRDHDSIALGTLILNNCVGFRGSEALLILVAKSLTGHRLSHEPRKP
jgi:hypothetical protein